MLQDKRFLTPAEVAARWSGRVTTRTLANWRSQGRSPPYLKLNGAILYPRDKLEQWEQRFTVTSTCEYGSLK